MASAEVTMIPQNYVALTDETALKQLNRTLDMLDAVSYTHLIRDNQIQIAALTLPKSGAEELAPILVENGVKAIWNFAHRCV